MDIKSAYKLLLSTGQINSTLKSQCFTRIPQPFHVFCGIITIYNSYTLHHCNKKVIFWKSVFIMGKNKLKK